MARVVHGGPVALWRVVVQVHWITATDPKPEDVHAQELIAQPNVKHWSKTRMECIDGDGKGVTGVRVVPRTAGAEVEELPVEGVFICASRGLDPPPQSTFGSSIRAPCCLGSRMMPLADLLVRGWTRACADVAGSKPITDFLEGSVVCNDDGGVAVDDEMATNVPGVYAIGDIRNTPYAHARRRLLCQLPPCMLPMTMTMPACGRSVLCPAVHVHAHVHSHGHVDVICFPFALHVYHAHRYKQVVVAASDGCIAAMSAERYLKGRKTVKVDWIHK